MIDILWSLPIVHALGIGTWILGTAIAVYSRIG